MAFNLTEETQQDIIELVVVALGEAPGTDLFDELADVYQENQSLEAVAEALVSHSKFTDKYPPNRFTAEKFATDWLSELIPEAPAEAMMVARNLVLGEIRAERSLEQIIIIAANYLSTAEGDEAFATTFANFANKVEVATYYTLTAEKKDPSGAVLEGVTSDEATAADAIRNIDSPPADAVFDMVGALNLHENADGSSTPIMVGTVTASDANDDPVTYSIEGDPADWMIDEEGNLHYVGTGVDYEASDTIHLDIIATSIGADGTETHVRQHVDVMVGDVKESDAVFGDTGALILEENADGSSDPIRVGSVAATDAEGDSITYGIVGEPADWMVDDEGNLHYVGSGVDYEESATIDLEIEATSIGADNTETTVTQTVQVMVGDVDDLPDEPMTLRLTPESDNIPGGDADDTFIAEPVRVGDAYVAVLDPSDRLDGGEGTDTLEISNRGLNEDITLNNVRIGRIKNIENVEIDASEEGINVDLRNYEGLEKVDLVSFGREDTVKVTVDGGATVVASSLDPFGGDVTIVGAAGEVNLNTGDGSEVHVGSAGETKSVMVKGGKSVKVDNGAGKQSETVTKVVVDGVAEGQVTVKTPAIPADTSGVSEVKAIGEITGVGNANNPVYFLWDADDGLRKTISTEDKAAHAAGDKPYWFVATTRAQQIEETGLSTGDNVILITDNIMNARGYVPGTPAVTEPAGSTVMIHSDAIETVQLHNTKATAVVRDESKTEDGKKGAPESLTVAVDDFDGHLHLKGVGASDDVTFNVVKDSGFKLAANAVKTINVEGDGKLELDVNRLPTDKAPMKASDTLETLVLSGAGDFMMDAEGMSKLKSIDASMSSGDNTIESEAALDALETVMGGAGKDKIELVTSATGKLESIQTHGGDDTVKVTGDHRTAGLMVDLGAGDDTFEGDSGGNKNSRIDGGEGRDTLKLSAEPADNGMEGDAKASIFSNFEVLDVGGGTGTFDIALLGVDTVVARGGTNGEVTLSKIADGMGITVHGEKGEATDADIVHDMPEDLRRYSGELDINLLAIGGDEDTKSVTTGEVTLTLAADENIEVLNVDSSATVGGSKRENPSSRNLPGASDYENVLTLKSGESENIEDIYISGDAKLEIRFSTPYTDDGLDQLDKIDASDNSGGITFSGAPVDGNDPFEELELVGGSGKDMLTGGAAGDEIEGNAGDDTLNGGGGIDEINGGAGGDMLNGGDGDDIFQYRSPSDSQVSWTATGAMIGFDTIVGFTTTADEISLGRTIYNGLHRQTGATLNTVTGEINDNDAATAATDNSLREWLGDGNGVFESTTGTGLSAVTTQHAVTRVTENYNREFNETEAADPATAAGAIDLDGDGINDVIGLYRTWILIDVNADGDFDSAVDMAIALTGAAADTAVGFALGDLGV